MKFDLPLLPRKVDGYTRRQVEQYSANAPPTCELGKPLVASAPLRVFRRTRRRGTHPRIAGFRVIEHHSGAMKPLSEEAYLAELNKRLQGHKDYRPGMQFIPHPPGSRGRAAAGYDWVPKEEKHPFVEIAHAVEKDFFIG